MDATNRDIFISEFIIHYLQSRYPNKYSDQTIVNNYKEYRKLRILKEVSDKYEDKDGLNKMSDFDLNRLKDLHEYFYGTSDGSNPSSGNNIARDYQILLNSVKHIIEENDNAIKDIVSNITSLLETSSADNPNPNIANMYLDNVIISPLIIALESSFDEELKISKKQEFKVTNVDEKTKLKMFDKGVVDENKEIKHKKEELKRLKDEEILKRKNENELKDQETKKTNKEEADKAKIRIYETDIEKLYTNLKTCFNKSEELFQNNIYNEAIDEYRTTNTDIKDIENIFKNRHYKPLLTKTK